ncbi:KAP family P-loop NTPase fold protein [Candidatus Nitrotoga fabula]|uniref:P-loop ATPase n=1 Tax=Candidatus Nitrotoga fabula TaxID=2182327 RepID=A0A916BCA8_9PROT|nr:P-loop NTPase fold protein [Candidatus Nitrotoga fabula]CAE6706754.1 Putative P-loop ATPase [Candidatus Nitrotoga fabula]
MPNDLPALEDKLEWQTEKMRILEHICKCEMPHIMGVHGDWGSGKTSFMRQLEKLLKERLLPNGEPLDLPDTIIPIWFDAWQYQNEPVPVVALLHEIRRQMQGIERLKAKFEEIGTIALYSLLDGVSGISRAIGLEGISAEKIEQHAEKWEQQHHAQALASDTIRNQLKKTIQCLLPTKEYRLAVFIDDLDRCNPKAAFRLLEGLKIYLSIPNCVFILGMNERILVDAIREEISAPKDTSGEELKLRAAHYLEKICTDIYRLPIPNDPLKFLLHFIPDENHKTALRCAILNKKSDSKPAIPCLPPNPRRLKALARQWLCFSQYLDFPEENTEQQKYWAARILIAAYVHQFHRDLWERWHFNPDFFMQISAWCNNQITEETHDKYKWIGALKLSGKQNNDGTWTSGFPNPGDIDTFWMDSLINEHPNLVARDFTSLLNRTRLLQTSS